MLNTDIFTTFSMQAAVIIPIITAIVQAFKFWVNEKFAPFIAMLVGIGITFLFAHDALNNLSGTILLGLLFGLAASGLYSGLSSTKAAIQEMKVQRMKEQEARSQDTCKK